MSAYFSSQAAPFFFPEGKHGILLIHGFTGSPAHMRELGEKLHAGGFAVKGLLLPGHGTTPAAMQQVDWQDWLSAVRTQATEMAKCYPHFSVAGLSMGGILSLLMAEEMPLTACVSIAAPIRTVNKFRWIAPLAAPLLPMMHKKHVTPGAAPEENDGRGYVYYPTKSIHDLSMLMRLAGKNLSAISCPLLTVQSHADRTVTADSPSRIHAHISSSCKDELWLENAPHVCTLGPNSELIAEKMIAFLRKAENR